MSYGWQAALSIVLNAAAAPNDDLVRLDAIRARIAAERTAWIRDAEQYDDLTFIVMKVR